MTRIPKSQRIFGTVKAFTEKGRLLAKTELESLCDSRDIDEIQSISEIEQSFEKQSYKRSVLSYTKMFSYSTMIGAIKLKQFEVKNLGTICFGVEQHLDSKNITPHLLFQEEVYN